MPLLASEVMDESASVYLNDAAKNRWTYDILLPYLRSAVLELQAELEDNELPQLDELAAIITVAPGVTELPLPSDFVLPIELTERAVGETRFQKMDNLHWEPDADPDTKLQFWIHREGKIQFLGATTTREVRLKYVRSLSTVTGQNSVMEIANAKGFLAARTAGLASSFGGSATVRGTEANARATWFLNKIIGGLTKRLQGKPVRRRRYRWR